MTAEQIKEMAATDLSTNGWLRELCYQVALQNEKKETARSFKQATQAFHVDPKRKAS